MSDPGGLRRELDEIAARAWKVADRLVEARRDAAGRLAAEMRVELGALGMEDARFTVEFAWLVPAPVRGVAEALVRDGRALGTDGPHQAEFFLEANPGEGARPLVRVASGGELSRLMLALRNVTGSGSAPSLVFDEVDAGIGGAAAEIVGRRLRRLAARHQVICVTHLPQIAAFADHHYAVQKQKSGGRTRTRVVAVEGAARLQELARMLVDASPGEGARRHAAEIWKRARGSAAGASPGRSRPRTKAARSRG